MRRNFQFLGVQSEDGFIEHDRDEVRQALLDLEGAVFQLGGMVTMSAVRHQIGDDAYVTTGVVMTYDSFSPAVKRDVEPIEVEDVEDGAAHAS